MKTVYVLNTPVITAYGDWQFSCPLSVAQAQAVLADGLVSATGHQGTAELLSTLLDIEIPTNRISIEMQPGDKALVFQKSVWKKAKFLAKKKLPSCLLNWDY